MHAAETFVRQGDQFTLQYLLTAHPVLTNSRLFSMGHALELYAKAVLSSRGVAVLGHDVPKLLAQVDPRLSLHADVVAAGEALFSKTTTNFDMGLQDQYLEELEIYQATYFLADQKYYLGRDMLPIYPVRRSLMTVNGLFIELAAEIRAYVPSENVDREYSDWLMVGFDVPEYVEPLLSLLVGETRQEALERKWAPPRSSAPAGSRQEALERKFAPPGERPDLH